MTILELDLPTKSPAVGRAVRELAAPLLVPLVLYLMLSSVVGLNRTYVEWCSWDTENIEDVSVAMGKWVAQNLPPGPTRRPSTSSV